nr:MAG TPA: hypothetical protein [Caudoviricetes sp.]
MVFRRFCKICPDALLIFTNKKDRIFFVRSLSFTPFSNYTIHLTD